jgi:hypothetical protein
MDWRFNWPPDSNYHKVLWCKVSHSCFPTSQYSWIYVRSASEQCPGYSLQIVQSVMFIECRDVTTTNLHASLRECLRVHCWICLWSIELVSETWASKLIVAFLQKTHVFIRCSSSGVSYRFQHFSLNLVNFRSHFSLYPSFSVGREWYSRLVVIYLLFTHQELQPIVPGCMCEWLHCDSFEGFWIQNEHDTRCIR